MERHNALSMRSLQVLRIEYEKGQMQVGNGGTGLASQVFEIPEMVGEEEVMVQYDVFQSERA